MMRWASVYEISAAPATPVMTKGKPIGNAKIHPPRIELAYVGTCAAPAKSANAMTKSSPPTRPCDLTHATTVDAVAASTAAPASGMHVAMSATGPAGPIWRKNRRIGCAGFGGDDD